MKTTQDNLHQHVRLHSVKAKNLLTGMVIALSSVSWVPTAAAAQNGFASLEWTDSAAVVQKQTTDMKLIGNLGPQERSYMANPKPGAGFLDVEAITPYRYHFFKDRLSAVTFDVGAFHDGSPGTVKRAKAEFTAMKEKIARGIGITPVDTLEATAEVPFFLCIYDDGCGIWGSVFETKDSTLVLALSGSEDGRSSTMTLTVNEKRND